jgi:hypothetical protein
METSSEKTVDVAIKSFISFLAKRKEAEQSQIRKTAPKATIAVIPNFTCCAVKPSVKPRLSPNHFYKRPVYWHD